MKKIMTTLAMLFIVAMAAAKSLAGMEYFWDSDPGTGNGTSVSAADGNWNSALEYAINNSTTTPAATGTHTLSIRSRDNSGVWGAVRSYPIYVEGSSAFVLSPVLASVAGMEFFWDTDPGAGAGTPLSALDGNWGAALEAAINSGSSTPATPGTHTLSIRSKDQAGTWSAVRSYPIYVEGSQSFTIRTSMPKTTSMEYFWDTDPGAGAGIALSAADGNWGAALENAIANSATTPATSGTHTLNIRSQDESGVWSSSRAFPIYVEGAANFTIATSLPKVSAMEFFWDTDPGSGSGIALTATDGNWGAALEEALKSGTTTPATPGAHQLSIRSKDESGVWSAVRSFPIYVESAANFTIATSLPKVTAMEYFWDTDPGAGSGIALSAADGNWGSALENALKSGTTTPATPGAHQLSIRSKDETGVWSAVRSFPIYVESAANFTITTSLPKVTAMEYFWDTDPGAGSGIALTATDGNWGSALENALKSGTTTPATAGAHQLSLRSKDESGVWSAVRSFPIYVESAANFTIATAQLEVVNMEYFTGKDPGVGSATKVTTLVYGNGKNRGDASVSVPTTDFPRGPNFGGVRVQDKKGNWSATRPFTVFVESNSPPFAPVITGKDSVCNVTANANQYRIKPDYDADYTWSVVGGTLVSSSDTLAVINWDTLATVHTLKVVGKNSYGDGDTTTRSVFVESTPSIVIAANGNYLAVTKDSRWRYQWTKNAVDVPGATQFCYWATEDGNYRCIVTTQCDQVLTSNRATVVYNPDQQYPKEPQSVTFDTIPTSVVYGSAGIKLKATATSGLPVTFTSSDTNVVRVIADSVVITGVGTAVISAKQIGNQIYEPSTVTRSISVTTKSVTLSSVSAVNKVYDGTTSATLTTGTLTGVVAGDTITLVAGTATFADKLVGTGKPVSVTDFALSGTKARNYVLAAQPSGLTANITAKPLTLSGVTATSREYNGTVAATISSGTLTGVANGDVVVLVSGTASFADKMVGTAKPVTVTTCTISGQDASNYLLTNQPSGLTADITIKSVSITGVAVSDKEYDGTTAATISGGTLTGLISGDVVTLSGGTGSFADATVGTAKPVTVTGFTLNGVDASNYQIDNLPLSLTASIVQSIFTQTIILKAGWNMVSFNVLPSNLTPATLFAGLDSLKIVKDDAGKSYNPVIGVDGIKSINSTKGYKLYMSAPDTLTVTGTAIDPLTTTIQLAAGWNVIPYLSTTATTATNAFASIKSKLAIVKDDEGKSYNPTLGIDGIGTMKPGKGYKLYSNESTLFTYPNK